MSRRIYAKLPVLSQERVYEIVRRPIITEKATNVNGHNQQVFEVALSATKPEIKVAIETIFKVKVKAVNTLRVKGRVRRFKGFEGRTSDYKKAYVTLAEGSTLDVMAGI